MLFLNLECNGGFWETEGLFGVLMVVVGLEGWVEGVLGEV